MDFEDFKEGVTFLIAEPWKTLTSVGIGTVLKVTKSNVTIKFKFNLSGLEGISEYSFENIGRWKNRCTILSENEKLICMLKYF